MADNLDVPEDDDGPAHGDASAEESVPDRRVSPVVRFPALDAFSSIQRQLAVIDFSAVRAAQGAFDQSAALRIREVLAAQDLVAKHFAQSIDFSHLKAAYKAISDTSAIANVFAAQKQWAHSLVRSIHFPALEDALASSVAFTAFRESNAALLDSTKSQADIFARIAAGVDLELPTIDIAKWLEALDRWIPGNCGMSRTSMGSQRSPWMRAPTQLGTAHRDRLRPDRRRVCRRSPRDPRSAPGRHPRRLRSCVASVTSEWAEHCRAAISAMRLDLDGPAQSHASNIIDSVVLALHGVGGRDNAKARAQEDFDDLPLQLAAENLTLRPLFRALITWWPNSGVTPPDHFARHPTAHAVGYAGVFAPRFALFAVMLATSLTVQYSPGDDRDGNEYADAPP